MVTLLTGKAMRRWRISLVYLVPLLSLVLAPLPVHYIIWSTKKLYTNWRGDDGPSDSARDSSRSGKSALVYINREGIETPEGNGVFACQAPVSASYWFGRRKPPNYTPNRFSTSIADPDFKRQ